MLTTPQYIIDIALNAKDEIFLLINSGNLVKLEKAGIQSNSDGTVLVADENAIDVYKFDSTGKILSTIDSIHGSEILKYNYTANGDLESISDVDGQSTTITHDGSGRVQSISSPYGETTRLSYDADGLLAAIVDPASRALSYEYDDQGLLTRSTDARGNASNYDYNSQGLLISDTDAAGFKKTYSRNTDVSHNEIEAKSPMGRVRKFTSRVSADGVLFRKFTAPDGSFTSSIQDAKHNSNLVSTTGEHFDSVSQVDPRFGLGSSIPMSVSKTTPEGVKAEANFARSITLQNNSDFLSLNTLTDETSYPGLGKFTSTYDRTTRSLINSSPSGYLSKTMFDAKGRPVKVEGSKLFPLELVYDATGRVVSKNYGGRNQSFSYNSQGRLASVTNALGQTSRYSYDNAGRIFQIQKPDGRLLKFTFDENDNLRSLIQPKNQTYSFAFDELNQTVLDTDPAVAGLNREWSYNYDSDRMRIRDQFPNGQNVEYRYDNYGRMISTETLLGSYKYNYDSATSQVVGVTTPENNSLTYGWDGNLQTSVKWAGKVNGLLTRNYETQMRLHSENVMNVVEIPYSYTAEGSLASAGGLNLSYDSLNGFLLESTLLGTVERLTYSDFGELASRKVSLDNIEIYREVFIRDALGGISQISRSEQGVNESLTYSYDSTGRLIVAKNGTTTESFTYDANDNRILDTQTSYDDQDRLVHNKDFTFTYDARGHMSSKTARNTNAKTIYEYDNFGQLLSIKDNTGLNLSYVYDGEGRQVARLKNGIVTRALLYRDRLNPVAELEANGTLKSVFVYGSRRNVPEYMDRGGVIFRFVADHLGSVRMVVNLHTKVVVQRITYDAWGRVLSDSNPGFQPFGFAGGIYDIDSKLVRFGARDYDSVTGRWIDKDPIKFNGGANFYSYVNADPVNKIDPSGLVCEYSQGTGQMNCVNELGPYYTETGYAGKGVGKNNPTMENVENFGPTPRGAYTTGELFKHIPAGKNTRRLYPDAATADRIKSMGRDPKTFMMHGDKSTNPGNASEGCIVLSPARTIIPTGELIIVKE